ncbi:hypothetical protein HJG60_009638 [Phyllostomus discolor]|uniref:Uncharacterized protein n=1 Tax=Phyllostomus discolor TaxID=89673 RepID=A0A834B7Y0_9CHIR|nr:hypothetical protein HJG60_009638 [Phyllostomus discolor]
MTLKCYHMPPTPRTLPCCPPPQGCGSRRDRCRRSLSASTSPAIWGHALANEGVSRSPERQVAGRRVVLPAALPPRPPTGCGHTPLPPSVRPCPCQEMGLWGPYIEGPGIGLTVYVAPVSGAGDRCRQLQKGVCSSPEGTAREGVGATEVWTPGNAAGTHPNRRLGKFLECSAPPFPHLQRGKSRVAEDTAGCPAQAWPRDHPWVARGGGAVWSS